MESRKMVMMNRFALQQEDAGIENRFVNTAGRERAG